MKTPPNFAIRLTALCVLIAIAAVAKAQSRLLYDVNADARLDIAAAIRKASKTGRNVVLIFGANW